MFGPMEGKESVQALAGVQAGEAVASWGPADVSRRPGGQRSPGYSPPRKAGHNCSMQQAIFNRPADFGHLVRQLKLFESLRFERACGEPFFVTLLSCSGQRVALDLEVPRIGRFLLAFTRQSGDRLRLDICHGPERALLTTESKASNRLSIIGAGRQRFELTVAETTPPSVGLFLQIPTMGGIYLAVRPAQDRARLQIVADRQIRIVPTPDRRNRNKS